MAVIGGSIAFMSSAPPGPIFTSANSGTNWTVTSVTNADCTSVASSADGSKLVAVANGGPIYSSMNSGTSWTMNNPTFPYLVSVASSADGTRLMAGTADPFHDSGFPIYLSTNSGTTWEATSSPGSRGRTWVALSADGTRLVAVEAGRSGGPIIASTNSGATWMTASAPITNWSSVAISADGGKVVAVVNGGGIYTSQSTPAPLLSITSSSGEAIISWTIPSTSFVLQQNSDLTSTNWTNVPAIPTLTNLRYQVTLSSPNGHDFYRLMQR